MAEQIIRTQEFVQAIQEALEANEIRRVREFLAELEPYEISDLLESLPAPVRAELWVHIDSAIEGEVLSHATTAVRNSLLEGMEPAQVAEATSGLDSDDVADILQDLPEDVADEILLSMDEQNRQRIATVLTYPYDTAGGLMNVDAVTVRSDVSVDVVLRYLRRLPRMPENTDQLMVVDRSNTFLGTLRLMALVMATPDAAVKEVMSADERANLPDSVAVLDEDGTLAVRTAAVLRILDGLGGLWRVIAHFLDLVPRPVADFGYDRIAAVRKRLFPQPDGACPLVPPELASRFELDD